MNSANLKKFVTEKIHKFITSSSAVQVCRKAVRWFQETVYSGEQNFIITFSRLN